MQTWTLFLFFNTEMKPFDPGFGSPKMENVSSCTMFLLSLNFQLTRKISETEKKNPIHQSLFFLPGCSSEEFGCSLSSSSVLWFNCFHTSRVCLKCRYTCLPEQCYCRCIPFRSHNTRGTVARLAPVYSEESRCITSSTYILQDRIIVSQWTLDSPPPPTHTASNRIPSSD